MNEFLVKLQNLSMERRNRVLKLFSGMALLCRGMALLCRGMALLCRGMALLCRGMALLCRILFNFYFQRGGPAGGAAGELPEHRQGEERDRQQTMLNLTSLRCAPNIEFNLTAKSETIQK